MIGFSWSALDRREVVGALPGGLEIGYRREGGGGAPVSSKTDGAVQMWVVP
ncbi:MAG: hypothetical protein GX579_17925 [Chloroflexi bacterium]|jgi:hypothetical protein|nr:hypothetical protein [Chloroflexota bacterium]